MRLLQVQEATNEDKWGPHGSAMLGTQTLFACSLILSVQFRPVAAPDSQPARSPHNNTPYAHTEIARAAEDSTNVPLIMVRLMRCSFCVQLRVTPTLTPLSFSCI